MGLAVGTPWMSHPGNELPWLNLHHNGAIESMLTQQMAEVQAVFEYNQKNFKYDREMRQAGQ